MNILVTGGAGYIGTELVKTLAGRADVNAITIYDNLSRANFNVFLGSGFEGKEKVRFVKGELLDSRALRKVLRDIDTVYHLAAKVTTPFDNTDPHFYEQVNHWGTAELVYAVEESPQVQRFIFVSSTGVYGSGDEYVTEATAPNPQTVYGTSKLRGEEHVSLLTDKIKTIVYRCGNVYGYSKSMRFDAVINKFMFDARFTGRITIHGNGHQHRSFIHINEVTQALSATLNDTVAPGTYNLVRQTFSVLDIVEALKEIQPELEFIFINQHLTLRELRVEQNQSLNALLNLPEVKSLKEDLSVFEQRFSF
jgi:UDP-glucose 4-epimerase